MKEFANCWSLKGCPASHYINCEAYRRRIDCWELGEGRGCLCRTHESCQTCPIYRSYLATKRKS
jgi:hypothetical protein